MDTFLSLWVTEIVRFYYIYTESIMKEVKEEQSGSENDELSDEQMSKLQ